MNDIKESIYRLLERTDEREARLVYYFLKGLIDIPAQEATAHDE